MEIEKSYIKIWKILYRTTIEQKQIYIPLQAQPKINELLTVYRYYVKHTEECYQKQVSWIHSKHTDDNILACYEYQGYTLEVVRLMENQSKIPTLTYD